MLTHLYFALCLLLFTESVTNFIDLSTSHFLLALWLVISQHFLWHLTLAQPCPMASFLMATWNRPILLGSACRNHAWPSWLLCPLGTSEPVVSGIALWGIWSVRLADTGLGRNPSPIFLILHLVMIVWLLYPRIHLSTVLQAATVDLLELACKLKAFSPSLF